MSDKKGLYINEGDVILFENDSYIVVHREFFRDSNFASLWSFDGEILYGNIPANLTVDQFKIVADLVTNSWDGGVTYGVEMIQGQLRDALGLDI